MKHPLFARVYSRLSSSLEKEVGPCRQELVGQLSGDILEVGCGNGMNFAHYPAGAPIIAIEPEPFLRARAVEAAAETGAEVEVRDGNATSLPFAEGRFDVVVACLVLCSVDDQDRALHEIARVLKPDGRLVFLEHVRSDGAGKAWFQVAADRSRLWPLIAGGCHCSCQTLAGMESAGFRVTSSRQVGIGPAWLHTNPHVIGEAGPA